MALLDSNIIIYSSQPEFAFLQDIIRSGEHSVSMITKIECLGFHNLSKADKKYLSFVFDLYVNIIPIDEDIALKAVFYKQIRKMGLADGIIGATAQHYNLELITRNTEDFIHIPDLNITNPIDINT